MQNGYVADALKWVKENPNWIAKNLGGAVAVGGIVAEQAFAGHYDPAKWIGAGSHLWALGDIIEGVKVYLAEDFKDVGTKIKLAGSLVRALGATYLGVASDFIGSNPAYNPFDLVPHIGVGGGTNLAGISVDRLGTYVKERESPRHRLARRLDRISKKLRTERKIPISEGELRKYERALKDLE